MKMLVEDASRLHRVEHTGRPAFKGIGVDLDHLARLESLKPARHDESHPSFPPTPACLNSAPKRKRNIRPPSDTRQPHPQRWPAATAAHKQTFDHPQDPYLPNPGANPC